MNAREPYSISSGGSTPARRVQPNHHMTDTPRMNAIPLLFTFRDSQVQTVLALPTDLAAFETFWA